jgi:hypothetical protein
MWLNILGSWIPLLVPELRGLISLCGVRRGEYHLLLHRVQQSVKACLKKSRRDTALLLEDAVTICIVGHTEYYHW